MPFVAGNQYGKHNNHFTSGRLTREQLAELANLIPGSLAEWKYVLDKKTDAIEWHRLKVDVSKGIIDKFKADLLEISETHGVEDGVRSLIETIFERVPVKTECNNSESPEAGRSTTVTGDQTPSMPG